MASEFFIYGTQTDGTRPPYAQPVEEMPTLELAEHVAAQLMREKPRAEYWIVEKADDGSCVEVGSVRR